MTEKPTATEMANAMIESARQAKTTSDLLPVGTFAKRYGDAHQEDITVETVQAFIHGTSVINLLVQEGIIRITQAANDAGTEAKLTDDKESYAFAAGVQEGAMLLAQLMAQVADSLVGSLVEGAAVEREFRNIVNNYK